MSGLKYASITTTPSPDKSTPQLISPNPSHPRANMDITDRRICCLRRRGRRELLLRGRREHVRVGLVATSMSLIPRKRFSGGHASTVSKFWISGLRYPNVLITLEASEDSPRNIQGGCRKRIDFKGYGRMDAAIGEPETRMSRSGAPG